MSYIILVEESNNLYGVQKTRIMQRSKLIDDLVFIVDPIYKKTHDMTKASVLMEYLLPVSKEYKTVDLILSDERYDDYYLQYKLAFDTDITSQAGPVEIQLTFAYADLNEKGEGIQRVRKTSPTKIEIIPIAAWSNIIPDKALECLDQRLIMMNSQIQAIDEYMNVLDANQVDNLVYNDYEDTLQLKAKGVGVGDKVSVREMLEDGVPIVDLNSDTDSGDNDNNKPDDYYDVVLF